MKELTPNQLATLDFIKEFMFDHKFPPAIRDVGGHFKISTRAAFDRVKAIEKKGFIQTTLERKRGIVIIDNKCAYCGK